MFHPSAPKNSSLHSPCLHSPFTFAFISLMTKKNRHRIFCCRFHHSLPDSRGDHVGMSVHRVNSCRRPRRLDADRARPMPESATPCDGTFATTLFLSWRLERAQKPNCHVECQCCQLCRVISIYLQSPSARANSKSHLSSSSNCQFRYDFGKKKEQQNRWEAL